MLSDAFDGTDFIVPPVPNTLFQRDPSCWIYNGVTCNPMYWPARKPETLLSVQAQVVQPSPPFDDLVVGDAEDLDAAQDERRPVGGHAHELAGAGAGRVEVLDDEVALGDVVVGCRCASRARPGGTSPRPAAGPRLPRGRRGTAGRG